MTLADWMDSICLRRPAGAASLMVRLFDRLGRWMDRSRQRAALGRLNDRMLADIGCDRASASAEADKPFWCE